MTWPKVSKPKRPQQEADRADRRVEHEQPDHDAGRPGQRAGDVVEEAQGPADARERQAVQQQREPDDEHDQRDQPEEQVQRHVPDGRGEPEVARGGGEVGQPGEARRPRR